MKIGEVVTLCSGQIRQFLTIFIPLFQPLQHTHTHTIQIVLWDLREYQDRLQLNKSQESSDVRSAAANMVSYYTVHRGPSIK